MNPFSTYRIINAEEIIEANIRPNHIPEDINGLLNVLLPVTYITRGDSQRASSLHSNFIQKLSSKLHTLDLLKHFGYELDRKGNYTYRSTDSNREITLRENATNEFKNFYNDLRRIKEGSLDDFAEYIRNSRERPLSAYSDRDAHEEQQQQRPNSSSNFRSQSSLLPNSSTVTAGNEKTSETIKLFKESIVPRHAGRPAHSFIRRKLLLLLYKQNYPHSIEFGDEVIDEQIDQCVRQLKQRDRGQDASCSDEVYFECLIRTNFDNEAALDILRHNRPNLKPPPEPETPRGPTTTTIARSMHPLQQQWKLLNKDTDENTAPQLLLHEGDVGIILYHNKEWKNATHIVTAIIKLRQQYNTREVDEHIVSKMYRLIYSELSTVIGRQSVLKIELLAYALCKVSSNSLEHLSMADIKDILRSSSDTEIHENFQDNAIKSLSMECPICTESYPRSRMETMFLCGHMCCLTCARDYYRSTIQQIRDPQALKKLTCYDEELEIADDVKLNFFQYLGSKLNQWFTDERLVLDAYHENLFLATRDSQIKKCGNSRCTSFFNLHNNNNRIVRAQCPHCQFQQCQQCCRKWFDEHNGMSCEQYAEWLIDNDPDDPEVQLTKYLNTAGMVCPNDRCKAIYEYKPGGCEHFTCKQCRTEFCRICSALFYNPEHNTVCPRADCSLKRTLHAHCCLNCYREIRDAQVDEIITLLTNHNVNVTEELRQKPAATGLECPVEGCKNAPSMACENRFCERCYKEFLCLLIWRNEIEPWELYPDHNLRQTFTNAGVAVVENSTREVLIQLARQRLTQFLGKPKKIPRIRQQ
ncbi:unnamed protein product [Rotaria sordida]|uniref:RING-type domain-containing protein n=1 Tax=Rotaria sordida TaxID=392033 RepID=A0A814ZWJ1_9BILA|nr:unnamed protein product [Rotaria sordida]